MPTSNVQTSLGFVLVDLHMLLVLVSVLVPVPSASVCMESDLCSRPVECPCDEEVRGMSQRDGDDENKRMCSEKVKEE